MPYYDVVGNDPDFDEMRKVVDIDGIRPEVNACHDKHEVSVLEFSAAVRVIMVGSTI